MRFKTNFSSPSSPWIRIFTASGWGVSLLALLLGAAMVVSGLKERAEIPVLKERLAKLKEQEPVKAAGAPAPSREALDDLRARLARLNALGAGKGRTLTEVLGLLEKLLPGPARLTALLYDQGTGSIQLTYESPNPEDLSKFLGDLEAAPDFRDVQMTKQSAPRPGGSGWTQSSIEMKVRRE